MAVVQLPQFPSLYNKVYTKELSIISAFHACMCLSRRVSLPTELAQVRLCFCPAMVTWSIKNTIRAKALISCQSSRSLQSREILKYLSDLILISNIPVFYQQLHFFVSIHEEKVKCATLEAWWLWSRITLQIVFFSLSDTSLLVYYRILKTQYASISILAHLLLYESTEEPKRNDEVSAYSPLISSIFFWVYKVSYCIYLYIVTWLSGQFWFQLTFCWA